MDAAEETRILQPGDLPLSKPVRLVDLPKNTVIRFAAINDEKMFPTTKVGQKLLNDEIERACRQIKRGHP